MQEQTLKKKKRLLIVLILIAAAVIAIVVYVKENEKQQARLQTETVDAAAAGFRQDVKKYMPDYFNADNIARSDEVGDITLSVSPSSTIEHKEFSSGDPYYLWTNELSVTLHTGSGFDDLTQRQRYNFLEDGYDEATRAVNALLDDHLPEFLEVCRQISDLDGQYKGEWLSENRSCEFFVRTPANLYRRANYVNDYYIMNGEEVFLRDPGSEWAPKETSKENEKNSSKGSSARSRSYSSGRRKNTVTVNDDDPYNARDYSDPEDFYEDYYDEFDDFEDAEDYYDDVNGY